MLGTSCRIRALIALGPNHGSTGRVARTIAERTGRDPFLEQPARLRAEVAAFLHGSGSVAA
jgi:hypothetical protein